MKILVNKLSRNARLPERAHPGDSGADLFSTKNTIIPPFESKKIETSIRLAIPAPTPVKTLDGKLLELVWEIQIRSKSGMAAKRSLFVLNSPATIDSGFLGELEVILFNLSCSEQTISIGDKIAQAVLCPIVCCDYKEEGADFFDALESDRGGDGFGSTGK